MDKDTKELDVKEITTVSAVRDLDTQEWYTALVDDIKSDLVETEFTVRQQVIELYHRVGKIIDDHTGNFNRAKVYRQGIVEKVASDVNRSSDVIWRALQFYKKFPNLESFLADKPKNFSWNQIKKEYLPEGKKEKKEVEISPEESEYEFSSKFTYDPTTDLYVLTIPAEDYVHIDFSKVVTLLRGHLETLN